MELDHKDIINLLEKARQEILSLRRTNELLAAKVEMIDLFACVLHTQPATHSVSATEDVARQLSQMMSDIIEKKAADENV